MHTAELVPVINSFDATASGLNEYAVCNLFSNWIFFWIEKKMHTAELMLHINWLDAADILGYSTQKIYSMHTFCSMHFFEDKSNCIRLRKCIQRNLSSSSIHLVLLLVAYMSMQYAIYYRIEYTFESERKTILQNWCMQFGNCILHNLSLTSIHSLLLVNEMGSSMQLIFEMMHTVGKLHA